MKNEKHKVLKALQTHYKRQVWGYVAEQRLLKERMTEYLRQDLSFYDYSGMSYTDYCVARDTYKNNSWQLGCLAQKLKDIKNEIKEYTPVPKEKRKYMFVKEPSPKKVLEMFFKTLFCKMEVRYNVAKRTLGSML